MVAAYLFSKWFSIDLFSILTLLFDVVGGEDTKDLTVLRAIRCLRLAKLIRLLRGSRIFKQWEMRISINYAHMELISLTIFILIFSHWVACFWGGQASFNPLNSWMYAKEYCVEWGVADEETAKAMLDDGSCPTDLGGNQMICSIGMCDEGKKKKKGPSAGRLKSLAFGLSSAAPSLTSLPLRVLRPFRAPLSGRRRLLGWLRVQWAVAAVLRFTVLLGDDDHLRRLRRHHPDALQHRRAHNLVDHHDHHWHALGVPRRHIRLDRRGSLA